MFSLHRPTPDQLRSLAARRATRPLSFRAGLLDRADATPKFPSDPRNGWFVDRCSATIGHGPDEFAAGRDALRRWQQFAPEWTMSMCPPAPIARGIVVAYAARVLGLWWSYGCRILEVIDEPTRYGFVYGTVAGHAECGEERFLDEFDGDDVVFSLFAMSRPGRWFSWPGLPIARRAQARFRSTATTSMREAVRGDAELDHAVLMQQLSSTWRLGSMAAQDR